MDPITSTGYQPESEPSHLFDDVADTQPYEKSLKRARIWLYIISAGQLIMGFVEYSNAANTNIGIAALCIDALMAGVFLTLALWSRKKPSVAFLSAIIFYSIFVVGFMILDATNLYRGIIVKVIVFIALVRAYNDARKYEAIKRSIQY